MSSVLIKGMEFPKSCYDCPLCYDMMECSVPGLRFFDKEACDRFDFCTERHPDCPLVEIDDATAIILEQRYNL